MHIIPYLPKINPISPVTAQPTFNCFTLDKTHSNSIEYFDLLHIISVRCLQLICITQIALFSRVARTRKQTSSAPSYTINQYQYYFNIFPNPIKIKIISLNFAKGSLNDEYFICTNIPCRVHSL